ncbi:SdpI family protein [Bifidobacterium sp. ESL0790]|uniref:SdpI family protein n=1 Tax=Bifidobacterium sp. ESL0790 TaxID=2983233 RepID=UPI0023F69870|nr:SdpI family protein [Bifidobacterium sp. ESL0790]WEV71678.1 SdpI family protein [Bifidobacterium sp. ESL0790]
MSQFTSGHNDEERTMKNLDEKQGLDARTTNGHGGNNLDKHESSTEPSKSGSVQGNLEKRQNQDVQTENENYQKEGLSLVSSLRNIHGWNIVMAALGLLPLIAYLLLFPYMPNKVPMHAGPDGVDRWGSKTEGLFLPIFSVLMCVVWVAIEMWTARSTAKRGNNDSTSTIRATAIGGCLVFVVINVINGIFIWDAFARVNAHGAGGPELPTGQIINVTLGLVFIVSGNLLPYAKPNRVTGVRIPGAYASREAWRRCQRFGGLAFIVAGIVIVIIGITCRGDAVNVFALLGVMLIMLVVVLAYGPYAARKYGDIGGPINEDD